MNNIYDILDLGYLNQDSEKEHCACQLPFKFGTAPFKLFLSCDYNSITFFLGRYIR